MVFIVYAYMSVLYIIIGLMGGNKAILNLNLNLKGNMPQLVMSYYITNAYNQNTCMYSV